MASLVDADRHRRPVARAGVYQRADQPVEPGVLRRAAKQKLPGVQDAAVAFHLSGADLHRAGGV
ncbi:hypothetical protein D3C79_937770 [compost metagenome]